jgi:hypothetical protein
MSFRDFQYSFGKFKTNVEGQFVKHIPYKNQDTKQLSSWINEDENNADLKVRKTNIFNDGFYKVLKEKVE